MHYGMHTNSLPKKVHPVYYQAMSRTKILPSILPQYCQQYRKMRSILRRHDGPFYFFFPPRSREEIGMIWWILKNMATQVSPVEIDLDLDHLPMEWNEP